MFSSCSNERNKKPKLVKPFAKVKTENQYIRGSTGCFPVAVCPKFQKNKIPLTNYKTKSVYTPMY